MLEVHQFFMQQAIQLAREAAEDGEIPVGAVAVLDNRIIGRGRNRTELLHDPTAHAEMEAITAAANNLENKRLEDVTLYVTLEPCPMCAGALVLARVRQVIYAVEDSKTGACGSIYRLHDDPHLNHQFVVRSGVMKDESTFLLDEFFKKLRNKEKLD